MKVLVDTSVWSLALLRRKNALSSTEQQAVHDLHNLIEEGRVVMLGVVRQELLSGIRGEEAFDKLQRLLDPFEDYPVTTADHTMAASLSNQARRKGVTVSTIDALIAAIALNNQLPVFTTDKDFRHLTAVAKVPLHVPQE